MLEFSVNEHQPVDSKSSLPQCQGACLLEDNRHEMTWVNLKAGDMNPIQSTH